ncbi:unnamed protein product [Moneuplotes crassus]|uniref:Uncharacterized protein n=1 Tax=Euplotes crassus TaxID=5936 RepID=A0AAD1U6A0_EUPCR|nr:unnamed protein product [Moneuplotes crassus]
MELKQKRIVSKSVAMRKTNRRSPLNEPRNCEVPDAERRLNRSVNSKSSTGRIFQYPLSGLLQIQTKRKFREDEFEQPYYKFVKVRKIFLNGKGLYELKLVQYCFVNSNLPLYNAVPLNMMLTENEEKRKQRLPSIGEAGVDDSYNVLACGRKKRKYVVKRERKKAINPYKMANSKKKFKKLDNIYKRINFRMIQESFQQLKDHFESDFEGIDSDNNFYEGVSVSVKEPLPLSLLKSGLNPYNSISMSLMPQVMIFAYDRNPEVIKPRKYSISAKKVDKEAYLKRCKQGLNVVSNILSRVELSRKKIIWDVLEEIRISETDKIICRKSLEKDSDSKSMLKSPSMNEKTEPSTEIDQQVIDKTDLDYYFLEKLEQMRDKGIKDEEYDLIEQNEKYSLERDDTRFDEAGYPSDHEKSDNNVSERLISKLNRGSKDLGNGILADYEEEEQVYYCQDGDLREQVHQNPMSLKSVEDRGDSSVYTLELKSILKDCNLNARLSDLNSDLTLSKCITGSLADSKNSDMNFTGKIMNEDIEMMSKEIEQIRDQILNSSELAMSKKYASSGCKTSPKRRGLGSQFINTLRLSSSDDGYIEDSD